jgi:hypothetical protein
MERMHSVLVWNEACGRMWHRLILYLPLTLGHRRAVFNIFHTICAQPLEFRLSWTSFACFHRCQVAVGGRSSTSMQSTRCDGATVIGAILELLQPQESQKMRMSSNGGHRRSPT